jgi:hypothetical protein
VDRDAEEFEPLSCGVPIALVARNAIDVLGDDESKRRASAARIKSWKPGRLTIEAPEISRSQKVSTTAKPSRAQSSRQDAI